MKKLLFSALCLAVFALSASAQSFKIDIDDKEVKKVMADLKSFTLSNAGGASTAALAAYIKEAEAVNNAFYDLMAYSDLQKVVANYDIYVDAFNALCESENSSKIVAEDFAFNTVSTKFIAAHEQILTTVTPALQKELGIAVTNIEAQQAAQQEMLVKYYAMANTYAKKILEPLKAYEAIIKDSTHQTMMKNLIADFTSLASSTDYEEVNALITKTNKSIEVIFSAEFTSKSILTPSDIATYNNVVTVFNKASEEFDAALNTLK
ncbi:hypothetical protein AAIR98_001292 [Elusimicrobium simillimum]|uniref:hypothetical protein n=1 Tax=Elusimicrobium simillimum TaxID=3143438 RepID=UPI003C6F4BB3